MNFSRFHRPARCAAASVALVALVSLTAPLHAQVLERAPLTGEAYLFTGMTLLDGRGGEPRENAAVLVYRGRIQSVGTAGQIRIPDGLLPQPVSLNGRFMLPGFVDAHAAPRDSADLRALLAAGVTTVGGAGVPLWAFDRSDDRIPVDDPAPEYVRAGPWLGAGNGTTLGVTDGAAAEAALERLQEADVKRAVILGELAFAPMRAATRLARASGLQVWGVPTHSDWIVPASAGVDGVSCLAAGGGDDFERTIGALLSRDVLAAPLLAASSLQDGCGPAAADSTALATRVKLLFDEQVRLAVGTGVPAVDPADAFPRELELLVGAGIPPLAVMTMATRNGAMALGILHDRGTIEAEKRADLLILGSNPLQDITGVRDVVMVMIDGRAYATGPTGEFERVRFR